MSFFAELKRRNVIRMAGLYLVGAWLVVQVAETLLPIFGTPEWVLKTLVMLLALGFVPALVIAWVFELTPEGLKRDDEVAREHSIAPQTARRMDRLIFAGLIALIAVVVADRYWPRAESGQSSAESKPAAAPSSRNAATAPQSNAGVEKEQVIADHGKSIAVLAFTDLSPEKDQEYFSDGMAEEILNALVRVPELKVAGRTSSFSFKGKNEDLRTIGKILGVAHILEGSVRKQGDRVRITAQLIRTADGFHLWSETFDGDLEDVFELQERIAIAITQKLEVVLQRGGASNLVQVGTRNAEAYELYLKATSIFNRREGARYPDAIDLLQRAIGLDAGYARAHSRLAAVFAVQGSFRGGATFASMLANVQRHAGTASELDPALAEPHAALAVAFSESRRHVEARAALARALELDPDDVTANFWTATQLINTGYLRAGDEALDRTLALDPLLPNALMWRGRQYVFDGDLVRGERVLRLAAEGGHTFVGIGQTKLDFARGDTDAAIASLTAGLAAYFTIDFPPEAPALFARSIYGDADAKRRALALIDAYLATKPEHIAGVVPYVLLRSGEVDRALELVQDRATTNESMLLSEMFRRNSEVKGAKAFPEFARRAGFAALWDRFGEPDHCHKNTAGDYLCE